MSIRPIDLKINAYYLVQSNNHGVLALKQLSQTEYEDGINASQWLHLYHYHKRREREVRLNLADFFNRYDYYQSAAINGNYNEKHEFFVEAYVDLNRVLTNFLSSFRLFVDNLEIFFKKEYGEHSKKFKSFKQILIYEFNSKFEYRLFYALRNYSQHKYFPINSVGLDNEVDTYTRQTKNYFTVSFDKDRFMSDAPENFRHVALDFKLYNRLFPVLPQMNKISKSIDIVGNAINEIEKERIIEMSNRMLKHYRFREGEGDIGLAKLKPVSKGVNEFDSKEIPINILREIYRDIEGKELPI